MTTGRSFSITCAENAESMSNVFSDYSMDLTISSRFPDGFVDVPHIDRIEGKIFYYTKSLRREICGRLICYFINTIRLEEDSYNLLQTFDDHSDGLSEVRKLYNRTWNHDTGYLKAAAHRALSLNTEFDFIDYDNFILIDRLEITRKHQGKGVGIHFLKETLIYLAYALRSDFYVMKPFPLQFENKGQGNMFTDKKWHKKLELERLEKNHKKALEKLRALYHSIGFELVERTNLMVCPTVYFRDF
jgi:hypothetical protein